MAILINFLLVDFSGHTMAKERRGQPSSANSIGDKIDLHVVMYNTAYNLGCEGDNVL